MIFIQLLSQPFIFIDKKQLSKNII